MSVVVAEKKFVPRAATANASVVSVATDPVTSTDTPLVQLKASCACGGGCPKCQVNDPGIQSRLTIGAPNDQYEQEADRVADQVMRMPAPHIQRQPVEEEDEETVQAKTLGTPPGFQLQRQPLDEEEEEDTIQTKANSGQTPAVSPATSTCIQSLKGGGQPLPKSTRTFFESRIGHDFNSVRIHSNSRAAEAAQSINARAFTLGNDVIFNQAESRLNQAVITRNTRRCMNR